MSHFDQAPRGSIIPLQEAAGLLNVSYATARRLAVSGELAAFRIGNTWRTSDVACWEYVERQLDLQRHISELELSDE